MEFFNENRTATGQNLHNSRMNGTSMPLTHREIGDKFNNLSLSSTPVGIIDSVDDALMLLSSTATTITTTEAGVNDEECYGYGTDHLLFQLYFVCGLGTTVALLSIAGNMILLYLFLTRVFFRRTYFFYFSILACFDLFHSMAYIAVFVVIVLMQYMENVLLIRAWHSYVILATTSAEVMRTTSTYILIAACIERYLYAHDLGGFCSNRKRAYALLGFTLFSILMKGTMVFEMEVVYRSKCDPKTQYSLIQTELNHNKYYEIYCFWVRNIVCVFLPFFLLMLFNVAVVLADRCVCLRLDQDRRTGRTKLKLEYHRMDGRRGGIPNLNAPEEIEEEIKAVSTPTSRWVSRAKSRVKKAATRTLIVIVIEYLVCHGLATVITAWEYIDIESLGGLDFYTYASDLATFLSVLSCAIRLPTYWLCDVTFRKELKWAFIGKYWLKSKGKNQHGLKKVSIRWAVDAAFSDRNNRSSGGGGSFGSEIDFSLVALAALQQRRAINEADSAMTARSIPGATCPPPAPSISGTATGKHRDSSKTKRSAFGSNNKKLIKNQSEPHFGGFRGLAARAVAMDRLEQDQRAEIRQKSTALPTRAREEYSTLSETNSLLLSRQQDSRNLDNGSLLSNHHQRGLTCSGGETSTKKNSCHRGPLPPQTESSRPSSPSENDSLLPTTIINGNNSVNGAEKASLKKRSNTFESTTSQPSTGGGSITFPFPFHRFRSYLIRTSPIDERDVVSSTTRAEELDSGADEIRVDNAGGGGHHQQQHHAVILLAAGDDGTVSRIRSPSTRMHEGNTSTTTRQIEHHQHYAVIIPMVSASSLSSRASDSSMRATTFTSSSTDDGRTASRTFGNKIATELNDSHQPPPPAVSAMTKSNLFSEIL